MSQRISFEGSPEVGVYATLTNLYALVGAADSTQFVSSFEEVLNIPVVQSTINGIKMLGSQTVGNSRGLLVPATTTDQELQHLRNSLPEKVRIRRVDERLNALGNIAVCNDYVALVHADASEETIEALTDVLQVDVFKYAIAGNGLVGSYSAMNNTAMLVSSKTTPEEVAEMTELLGVKIVPGTVNRGVDVIGGNMIINDFSCFVGDKTTSTEIVVVDGLFRTVPTAVLGEDEKRAWIDALPI